MKSIMTATTLAAYSLLHAASVSAHMIMTSPVPFSKSTLNNSPLVNTKPGSATSDYPCKLRPNPYEITEMNNIKVGEQQTLAFQGTATHGGGACQLAITLDEEPTANSVFKIIQVFEGGCPLHNFTYTIPPNFPNGRATFAWTWYNVIGNREIYMNCAPITVSGGADSHDYYHSLPNQYVINLPTSECSSIEDTVQRIPYPGRFVSEELGTRTLADATGPSCAASAAAQTQAVNGYVGAASTASGAVAAAATTAAGAGQYQPGSGQGSAPSASGMTTVPVIVSGLAAATAYPTFAPSANAGVAPGGPGVASGSAAGAVPTGSSSSSSSTGTSGTSASCTGDGTIVCNGENQFGLCNFGQVTWQAVAAGTVCQNGTIQKRNAAHNVHVRRHVQRVARKGVMT